MNALVRRAVADDAVACAQILHDWISGTDWMPAGPELDRLEVILRDGLPKREAWVVGDPTLGYLSLDPESAHIWGFYVGPTGQGYGKSLLDRVKVGRDFLRLNTHEANTGAHRFYRREGFVQVGDAWLGDDDINEITMEWRR